SRPQIEHLASSRDWEIVEPLTEWTGARTSGASDDVLPIRNAEARLCLQMKLAYRADAIMIWCEGLLMFRWGRATATIFFGSNRACLIKSVFHRRSKISAAGAGDVLSQRSFDVTGTRGRFFSMSLCRGIFLTALCTSVALAASPLVRAQDATSATLQESPKKPDATPTPRPERSTRKPSQEISTGTPNQKPAPVAEQTPSPEELAMPTAVADKKTSVN